MKGPRSRGLVLSELLIFLVLCFILASGVLLRSSIKNSRHILIHEAESFAVWITRSMNEARINGEVFDLDLVLVSGGNYQAVKNYVYGYRSGTQEVWYSDSIDLRPNQDACGGIFDGRQNGWSTALSFTFSKRRGNPMTKTLVITPAGYMYFAE